MGAIGSLYLETACAVVITFGTNVNLIGCFSMNQKRSRYLAWTGGGDETVKLKTCQCSGIRTVYNFNSHFKASPLSNILTDNWTVETIFYLPAFVFSFAITTFILCKTLFFLFRFVARCMIYFSFSFLYICILHGPSGD